MLGNERDRENLPREMEKMAVKDARVFLLFLISFLTFNVLHERLRNPNDTGSLEPWRD